MMDKLHTLWWAYVWSPFLHFTWAVECFVRGWHLSPIRTKKGHWFCLRCWRPVAPPRKS